MKSPETIGVCIATDKSLEYVKRAVDSHEQLIYALKLSYQFFSTEANTPDEHGLSVAPDSIVRVVLRKMREAIEKAEGLS